MCGLSDKLFGPGRFYLLRVLYVIRACVHNVRDELLLRHSLLLGLIGAV